MKSEFKQLIMNRECLPVKDSKLGLNTYYFVLNGHIVVLKTVLEDTCINNIQNSKLNILAMNMLFSINESESWTIIKNSYNEEFRVYISILPPNKFKLEK